jgi:uncharacterized protein YifE (UPF0438 family)
MEGFEVELYPDSEGTDQETWKVSMDSGECSACTGEKQFYVATYDNEQDARQTLDRIWNAVKAVIDGSTLSA